MAEWKEDAGIPKITLDELAALFGKSLPIEVAMFLTVDAPLIQVRKNVYRYALALEAPAPSQKEQG